MKKQQNKEKFFRNCSALHAKILNSLGFISYRTSKIFDKISHIPILSLIRFDKPSGTLLMVLPILWYIAIACHDTYKMCYLSLLFLIGSFIMRSIGCIVNDMFDKEIDQKVTRTAMRPLASGAMNIHEAFATLSVLACMAVLLLYFMTKLTTGVTFLYAFHFCAAIITPLIILYPLTKRFFKFPQIVLGFVFNLGIWVSWVVIENKIITWTPILIYIASIFWTIGYDTVYAYQDKEEDEKNGIKSMAVTFGDLGHYLVWNVYQCALLTVAILGLYNYMSFPFYIILALLTFVTYININNLDLSSKKDCAIFFRKNVIFGFVIYLDILLWRSI